MLKSIARRLLPKSLVEGVNILFDRYAVKSYSQEGEDMLLKRIFEEKSSGFYVDVGAHHPMRFSNTFFFYKKGWRGINIDAMPGSMKKFNSIRPRDINLEIPISAEPKRLPYYVFNEPALNGFEPDLSRARDAQENPYKIIKVFELLTKRLDEVLNEYLPANQEVDFLSIDVEGFDLEVIKSNNWSKYRPKVILVEMLGSKFLDIGKSQVTQYLSNYGYELYAKCVNTVIFRRTY